MSSLDRTDELFFTRTGMDRAAVESTVNDALKGADDGELFLEYRQTESLVWDDGKLKNASFDTTQVSACAPFPARRRAMPMP